ncbi:MAG: cation:proton antiporter [Desulfovibrionaceae bacterium]|nr:cation:proton antiporter [Desulfovibrionaceae bacterium]
MHEYTLLEILAAGFALALVFGYLALRLKLSPIVGYLLAGFLVGPQSPGFVADANLAAQLSEAGVILLMFGVGLHFKLEDLLAVKGVSLPGAVLQSVVATTAGAWAAVSLGLSLTAGLMLGMGLAVASTVVLLRVLGDNNMINTIHGHVSIGWLVVEDLFTVFILVLLPSVAGLMGGAEAGSSVGVLSVFKALGLAVLNLIALWVTVMVVGGRVIPWLLTHIVRTRSQELFTLTVLVGAFATAVGAAVFFHASMALGAFLGGMVIGKTELSHQAGADLLPLRDAFAVLFFLSVGMLFDPGFLLEQPLLIAICLGIVLLLKPLAAILAVTVLGYSTYTGLTVAISLAQVGEFSFILAQQAQYLGLIPDAVYNVLVACALVSITLNPGLFRTIPKIEAALKKREKLWHFLNARAETRAFKANDAHTAQRHGADSSVPNSPIALVVGYGPAGQSVAQALSDRGLTPVVIDLNLDTVNSLTGEGKLAIFGDASKRDILLAAGIECAAYLVITVPVTEDAVATAAAARSLNPDIRILARTRFLGENELLRHVGVDAIAFEEEEVAKSLAVMLLEDAFHEKPSQESL